MRCNLFFNTIFSATLIDSFKSLQYLQEHENLKCSENYMLTTYCAFALCVTFEEQLEIVKLKT